MEKALAISNVFLGLLAFSLQVSAMVLFLSVQDKVATGIWGGILLVIFALSLINKSLNSSGTIRIAVLIVSLIGVMMIALYSWSIHSYHEFIGCHSFFDFVYICPNNSRIVIDSLMIVCGILIVLVNGIIGLRASAFIHNPYQLPGTIGGI
ncbi:uncharacterized protein LOC124326606 [Daphnia pulicaria]|uniref:uncharacterized protein LOC124326606 n=1 Tax=Daphnia pulicaria TaxID=35523 RepID=UPI001EEA58F0|nr:uncharacterized protein LOC124326606 [Daphnia pulicaria]